MKLTYTPECDNCGQPNPTPNESLCPVCKPKQIDDVTRRAALKALIENIAETVKEAGQAPEGVIYAAILEKIPSMTAADFQALVFVLVQHYPIRSKNHLLTWYGPK